MTRLRPRPILVTGGAGYVGAHVTEKLLAQRQSVRVLDRFLYGDHGIAALRGHPDLEILKADVRDPAVLAAALRGCRAVIALAAIVGDAACDLDPDETVAVNVEATRTLAEACGEAGVRRIAFASSCSVYGAADDGLLDERSALNPVSLYGRTRLQSEEILARYAGTLSPVILRLATVFGVSPRMRLDLLVNTFTAQAYFRRHIRVFGGLQWRPNVHVQDVADAFILAATAPEPAVRGEVFNVGSDAENHTIAAIASLVASAVPGTRIEVVSDVRDARNYRVTFGKIENTLGFRPRRSVREGIAEVVAACEAGLVRDPDDARLSNVRRLQALARTPIPAAELARAA